MKKALKAFWNWIKPRVKRLFTLTFENVTRDVMEIMNDPELQSIALDCVKAVAKQGFKDNSAFDASVATFKQKLKGFGISLSDTLLKTLVQNAYTVFKYGDDQ